MIIPTGAADLREAVRCGAEVFPRAEGGACRTRAGHRGGRRGGLRARSAVPTRRPSRSSSKRSEKPATRAGGDVHLALDVASSEFYRDGAYHLDSEGVALDAVAFTDYLAGWVGQVPDRVHRGRHGGGRPGGLEAADRRGLGGRIQLVRRRTLFVTDPATIAAGIAEGVANFGARQGQPDSAPSPRPWRRIETSALGRLHRRDLAPFGGDGGHHHRGSRGGHRCGADQDRLALALGAGREVQTASSASRRASRRRAGRATPGLRAFHEVA